MLLKRVSFTALDNVRDPVLAWIDYYKQTMAKAIVCFLVRNVLE